MAVPSSMLPRPSLCAACLAAMLASFAAPASAEPTGADRAMADALFRAGRQLFEQDKFPEACPKFAESQRLDPQIGTLINLALCHEKENKTATAWGELNEAASQAQRAKQTEREKFARARAAALEKVLSRVVITAASVPGLALAIDGKPLAVTVLGAPLPLDPGEHVVSAEAPDKRRWEGRVVVPPGPANVTLAIPPLEGAAEPKPAPAPPVVAPPPAPAPPPIAPPVVDARSGPSGLRVAGAVVTGVGAATVVAGAVLGGLAFAREGTARKACPGTVCETQGGIDLHDEARRFATGSTAAFVAGGVVAAGGAVLLVLSRGRDKPSSTAWIAPSVSPFAAGLAAGGSF